MTTTLQPPLVMSGGFEPCPREALCGNCQHPLCGHWHETPNSFATACGQCKCQHWNCKHGGTQTGSRR